MRPYGILLFMTLFLLEVEAQCVTIQYGISTHQNKRPYQEDRFAHKKLDSGEFFGIYDGHGGEKVASFLQSNLAGSFEECLKSEKEVEKAFKISFARAERGVLKHFDDGATALVVYIETNNHTHYGWVGDTRAVLEREGAVALETKDHKPESDVELARIKKAGGQISKYGVWRVGGLAIARSIGDRRIKDKYPGQVIAIPEYSNIVLNEKNHFLIMASDGLWDVMTSKEAVDSVKKAIEKGDELNVIAQALQNEAMSRESQDNITVCVVHFDWKKEGL